MAHTRTCVLATTLTPLQEYGVSDKDVGKSIYYRSKQHRHSAALSYLFYVGNNGRACQTLAVIMALVQQTVDCLLWLAELETVTTVQRLPRHNSIKKWHTGLRESRSAINHK
jgi:hypothetical protein